MKKFLLTDFDNSKNVIHEETILSETEHETFSKYLAKKRKKVKSPSGKGMLTTRELALRLRIDYEQFRKIINLSRPTKNRDLIIAICAALALDSDETNETLNRYQYMPALDPQKNPRDYIFVGYLERNISPPPTPIEDLNRLLYEQNLPGLDIGNYQLAKKYALKLRNPRFEKIKTKVKTSLSDLFYGDQFESLTSEYSPYRYECYAYLLLKDSTDQKLYLLTSSSRKSYFIQEYKSSNPWTFKDFKSPEASGIYKEFFLELDSLVEKEIRRMCQILNDTRNYKDRVSANIKNGVLHIFAETFNYSVPETGEYYLFELIGKETKLSVYHNSEFMRQYLTPDEYIAYYGRRKSPAATTYTSLDELEILAKDDSKPEPFLHKVRLWHFERLSQKVYSLLKEIQDGKKYIRNLKYIYEGNPNEVCRYYGVDNDFQCYLKNDEYMDYLDTNIDQVTFPLPEGQSITITIQDLYRAFELGFNTIEEICHAKARLGSIDAILDI